MVTRTASGKVIRGGKGWATRVTRFLAQDDTLVAMARALTLTDVAQDADAWHACYAAVIDRIKELVALPDGMYESIMVASVCGLIRRGEL